MYAGLLNAAAQQRFEIGGLLKPPPFRTVSLGILDEIRIPIVETEIFEAQIRLFPLNHAVGVVP